MLRRGSSGSGARAEVGFGEVGHLGGEHDLVILAEETRRVGHHHQFLLRHDGALGIAGLEVGGVGLGHEAPARECFGDAEGNDHIALFVRAKLREEECRLVQVGADLHRRGFNRLVFYTTHRG